MLTAKQYEMLTLVDDHTKWEGDTRPGVKLTHYWIPHLKDWSTTLNRSLVVSGAGDAAIIRGLIRKGYVMSIPNVSEYGCAITEDGLIALEEYRQANVYVDGHFPATV